MPPKPPLLMHSRWSPGLAALTTAATRASTSAPTTACAPIGASASRASQARPCWLQKARSASSSAQGNWAFIVPSFIVLERGSKMARMRSAGAMRRRRPLMVVRMAVGWWAKSSYTLTPPTSPRSSMRRRTFWNSPKAAAACSGVTPTCSAAAMAASALSWLCSPISPHSTRASFRLPRSTSKAWGSPRARSMPASSFFAPKRCTSLQQPRASTRCSASSRALTTSRPLAGTVRTRWWNWVSMAARSGKMSAWSCSRLLSTAVRGR
mmetsp:Transcript_9625/g.22392  ORF Transcript_9625/g.22392 Transcript_9625/m.22392 type:complete len:266 (+) Transcript_9625:39-836(+)